MCINIIECQFSTEWNLIEAIIFYSNLILSTEFSIAHLKFVRDGNFVHIYSFISFVLRHLIGLDSTISGEIRITVYK